MLLLSLNMSYYVNTQDIRIGHHVITENGFPGKQENKIGSKKFIHNNNTPMVPKSTRKPMKNLKKSSK